MRNFVEKYLRHMDKLIFISNDDGYQAKGINTLAEAMRKYGDVFVVAPDSARSGASMSISSNTPVRNKMIRQEEGSEGKGSLTVWSCSGTPNDCTKMAFEKLLPRKADLVLGGINHGDNSAINAHYSGTMSIAMEGCMKGVPSIALSSGRTTSDADFEYMIPWVCKVVEQVMENGLPKGVCLNVNAPSTDDIKGIKICKMGMGDWHEEWDERVHPHGWTYYWIAGYYKPEDENDKESDTWAFRNGYVAITPIQLDLTAYQAMETLKTLEQ